MKSTTGDILSTYKTIVVVGLNSDPSRPSHYVSDYMRRQGYRIVGVNPDEDEVFGEKCYPDLASVPGPVDFVNVFRRPQFCPEIARQAVEVGAKALWLQSGIFSAEARQIAEDAGLQYVEGACVMVEHGAARLGRVG